MQASSTTPSAPQPEPGRSLAADYWSYVAIAYCFTWALLIAGVKLGWSEDYLTISGAGPAVAALILSQCQTGQIGPSGSRWLWFFGLLPLCWVVLSLRASWWDSDTGLPVHLRPLQLIPALAPAWILSSAASTNHGIRSLGRRLLHPPDRWAAFALLFFPVLLGIPSAIAYALGAQLVWLGWAG